MNYFNTTAAVRKCSLRNPLRNCRKFYLCPQCSVIIYLIYRTHYDIWGTLYLFPIFFPIFFPMNAQLLKSFLQLCLLWTIYRQIIGAISKCFFINRKGNFIIPVFYYNILQLISISECLSGNFKIWSCISFQLIKIKLYCFPRFPSVSACYPLHILPPVNDQCSGFFCFCDIFPLDQI